MKFVLAIDQGTSSTKTLIFDNEAKAVAKGCVDLKTNHFDNGFVEQDPEGVYQNLLDSVQECLVNFTNQGFDIQDITSCGISNQRETFVLWDKSGNAQSPAVVWACKRSISICEDLKSKGQEPLIKEKTGLIIDPYFSGTKLLWLLQNDADLKAKVVAGEIFFGTIDCWVLYKMTNGKSFKTDYTNASRTLFFNIHTLTWDDEILKLWGLENLNLPEVCPSSSDFGLWGLWNADDADASLHRFSQIEEKKSKKICVGTSASSVYHTLKITSLIGDSHAATFGEGCFEQGTAKVTLGTGSSIMMNIGSKPVTSLNGMLTTICWSTENRVDYALEGAIVSCGSTIEWLKNELNLFKNPAETAEMANAVADNAGVYLIPAFSGLGGPHWQMNRKASLEGLTFGTTKNHIVRAALESIPYQIKDVVTAMGQDMQAPLKSISVNGGMTRNEFVIKFLVDLLGLSLKKQQNADVSALGAAYLSGLKSGVYESIEQLQAINQRQTEEILPDFTNQIVQKGYEGWQKKISFQ
ncbi:FGGY family carbohydrate kinase [Arcicella sp. LKC2W]|uniref:FGGY family carbohydrate kinase n=1 Tax=Arcicella sp. LKC2W TaxID=2984198 RepID=UPI002B214C3A|nr:FGGY family carbohydrate kinase [Arcicella sp. LKC2W]MEA5460439.1 FGGY family carbohydrate kinase [Arcicella sp. LKC2W]